ncbi:MAG: hypothetical protein FWE61_03250 [Micrococcales bacterium]|nr:hypothetical protein [Micrococcales bacterium]
MQVIHGLSELVHQLPVLHGQVWVLSTASEQIQTGDTNALLGASYLAGPDAAPEPAWQRWYPAAVLPPLPWRSAPVDELVDEWFCPHGQVAADFDATFGDDDVPATTAIPPGMSSQDRQRWWVGRAHEELGGQDDHAPVAGMESPRAWGKSPASVSGPTSLAAARTRRAQTFLADGI